MRIIFVCVGKVFIYWLGTEPFLYIANAEFLKKMSTEVMAKRWGKPSVFRNDRDPMFGSGLVMVEGNDWVRHRHIIAPAFNPLNLKVLSLSLSLKYISTYIILTFIIVAFKGRMFTYCIYVLHVALLLKISMIAIHNFVKLIINSKIYFIEFICNFIYVTFVISFIR